MREEIYALIKKFLKEKAKTSLFRKLTLLDYLNIEEIVEELQRQSSHAIWDGIVNTFEKINNLRGKNQKEEN